MANLEQKVGNSGEKTGKSRDKYIDENDNQGLDADHSSENSPYKVNLNNDNDRISHNPDGEDDAHNTSEGQGYSPLMDK